MKKLLIVLLITFLAACQTEQLDIGLVLYNESDPFVELFASKIVDNIDNYSIEVYDSENSQSLQNTQLQELIDKETRLFLVNPVDRLSTFTLIRKLRETDTPVIFFNREPLRKDLQEYQNAYYVGAKAEQSGYIQADLVEELFGNPNDMNVYDRNEDGIIQILLFKGEPGHQDAELRSKSVIEALEEKGYQIEVVQTIIADWIKQDAYSMMKEIIEDEVNYEIIISNNDAMAIGAIEAMREYGIFRDDNEDNSIDLNDISWVPVIGVDGIPLAKTEIENGYMYGTVLNDSDSMALAISELSRYLLGEIQLKDMTYQLEDRYYIWIDYKAFTTN